MTLTASDRTALLRLASSLPKGDENRRALLVGLKKASEQEADKLDEEADAEQTQAEADREKADADRMAALKKASELPKGSKERRQILASLKKSFEISRDGYNVIGLGEPVKGKVIDKIGPFWAGGTFVEVARDMSQFRNPANHDPYMFVVVDDRNNMTHYFGSHPTKGYGRRFYDKHNLGH
jgi:hypothetical protein